MVMRHTNRTSTYRRFATYVDIWNNISEIVSMSVLLCMCTVMLVPLKWTHLFFGGGTIVSLFSTKHFSITFSI